MQNKIVMLTAKRASKEKIRRGEEWGTKTRTKKGGKAARTGTKGQRSEQTNKKKS